MYGAAIVTTIASNRNKEYDGDVAVTKFADERTTRKCFYSDARHKLSDQTQHKRLIIQ